jgi:hypothetical protein
LAKKMHGRSGDASGGSGRTPEARRMKPARRSSADGMGIGGRQSGRIGS